MLFRSQREAHQKAALQRIRQQIVLTADNSMSNSQIYAGAIVFIKKTDTIKNKDIVMISLNGKIFIRKYYYYTENQKLILYADNPDFEPMIFIGDEINNIKIIGKAIGCFNNL